MFAVKESPVALLKAITALPESALYHHEQFQIEEAQRHSLIILVVFGFVMLLFSFVACPEVTELTLGHRDGPHVETRHNIHL
jgi:hypothetical protein